MAGDGHSNPTLLSPTPDKWRVIAIEDLCENVTSGGTPLRSNSSFYQGGKHSWFKTQELRDSVLFQSDEKITDTALAKTSAKLFPKDTVLMAMYGDGKTITSLGILTEEAATNQACCAMIPDRALCEPRFLFYALRYHRDDFIRIASGGAQRNLSGKLIRRFALNTPPLDEQRAIAYILSTLDDKIELNRRMNKTLEAMARALFKSWFVDFDPVRAKAEGRDPGVPQPLADLFPDSFEDSELGEIPKDWSASSVYDMATYINGAAYRAFEPNEKRRGLPIVKIAELKAGVTRQTRFSAIDMPQKYRIDTGDILFSWSGNPDTSIDIFVWTHGQAWLNQHIFRVIPRSRHERALVLMTLRSLRPVFAEVARNKQTTGLGHVTVEDLKRLVTVRPPEGVLLRWNAIVEPVLARSFALETESSALVAVRDTLLPKLISGELRVNDAERFVESTM